MRAFLLLMKTKHQKIQETRKGAEILARSASVIFTDFTGVSTNAVNVLRSSIRDCGGVFQVVKKRLLKFMFKEQEIEFDPKQFTGSIGVVFSPKNIAEISSVVCVFSKKQKDVFKILGGFDRARKIFFSGDEVKRYGQLPSREILLGQLVRVIAGPMRAFLYVLSEKAKRS